MNLSITVPKLQPKVYFVLPCAVSTPVGIGRCSRCIGAPGKHTVCATVASTLATVKGPDETTYDVSLSHTARSLLRIGVPFVPR